jgi:hypothetical protein
VAVLDLSADNTLNGWSQRRLIMGEFSPLHFLIALGFLFIGSIFFVGVIPWLSYRHGKKVGDQAGYIRGYKEGQQIGPCVIDAGKC